MESFVAQNNSDRAFVLLFYLFIFFQFVYLIMLIFQVFTWLCQHDTTSDIEKSERTNKKWQFCFKWWSKVVFWFIQSFSFVFEIIFFKNNFEKYCQKKVTNQFCFINDLYSNLINKNSKIAIFIRLTNYFLLFIKKIVQKE